MLVLGCGGAASGTGAAPLALARGAAMVVAAALAVTLDCGAGSGFASCLQAAITNRPKKASWRAAQQGGAATGDNDCTGYG